MFRKNHTTPLVFVLSLLMSCSLVLGSGTSALANPDEQDQEHPFNMSIRLDKSAVLPGEGINTYILLTFQVPEAEIKENTDRPVMNLALVLDRSGSMEGAGKMDYAKSSAKTIVDMCSKHDTLAVVEYDDAITVLWPATPVESPEMIKARIDSLTPRGSTNLTGGMVKGFEEIMKVMHDEAINRVILLSDGLANEGITDHKQIAKIVREFRDKGISVSNMGLGLDYDEDLMQMIAENGGGNYYYIENPKSMDRIFRQEMSTLYATVAKDVKVKLAVSEAISDFEVFGYETEKTDDGVEMSIGNLYAGESRSLVLKLSYDASQEGELNLGALQVSYTDMTTNEATIQSADLNVTITNDEQLAANSVNQEVQAETLLVEADNRHAELVRLYESGDVDEAKEGIADLEEMIAAENETLGNVQLAKKLEALKMETQQLERAEEDAAYKQDYLKASKQRLYQSQKGKKQGYLIRKGDKGLEVENLQKALQKENFYKGDVDGVFDEEVFEALKAFQKAKGLTVDGIAGPATLMALNLY